MFDSMNNTRFRVADVRVPADLVNRRADFGGAVEADCLRGDLIVTDGRAECLVPQDCGGDAATVFDAGGRILIPGLVEVHAHLDKCHTINRLHDTGGDLDAAIASQGADKQAWTETDIRRRANRGLAEFFEAGCRAVRSHVDWGDGTAAPLAWGVLAELRQEWAGRIDLQLAALLDPDDFAHTGRAEKLLSHLSRDQGIPGIMLRGQAGHEVALRRVFELTRGFDLDFHVDEGLDPELNGIELIADLALATGFEGRILCGHACSLANRNAAELDRIIDKLARLDVSICALPATNLYLQGRRSGTPDRRGLTRLRELAEAGVRIVIGSDNVGDAFCPLGRHDPLHSLATAVLAAHLDPPFARWLQSVTVDAARAIGIDPQWIDGARIENLWLSDALHTADLIASGLVSPRSLREQLSIPPEAQPA